MKSPGVTSRDNKPSSENALLLKNLSIVLGAAQINKVEAISVSEWIHTAFSTYEASIKSKLDSLFRDHDNIFGVIVMHKNYADKRSGANLLNEALYVYMLSLIKAQEVPYSKPQIVNFGVAKSKTESLEIFGNDYRLSGALNIIFKIIDSSNMNAPPDIVSNPIGDEGVKNSLYHKSDIIIHIGKY